MPQIAKPEGKQLLDSWGGGKVQPRHRERLAAVYIRQSTMQQVVKHQESTRLQYGLVDRAQTLGWPESRVLTIDEDLGVSGSSAEGRSGFQRLVAEVSLDHVGIVLGVEMSRLARSCRDWYQLLEVCAVFGTLIGDLDGIYDPAVYNDRLLLGLKGTMSEAELHVIKQRMLQGKLAKAKRGELGFLLPMGYVCKPNGEVVKDPDEQAQSVIELVFDLFERYGTLHAVLRQLVAEQVQMPCRVHCGDQKGELEWRRPNRVSLSNLLHNPAYAGVYAYGRRPADPRRKQPGRPGTGRIVARPDEWAVCLKDRLPAYITWEQYERNLRQLELNTKAAAGVIRQGPSLLAGLIVCGRCGRRMAVTYSNNGKTLRYHCYREVVDYAGPACQSLLGTPLDEMVTDLVLQALKPAALDVSLRVAADIEAERTAKSRQWEQRLERAHYQAERAYRQYNAVEPENRLVARTLEKQWEEALAAHHALKDDYARYLASEPPTLSARDRERIQRLARDIPALWCAPTTTNADRQAIIRQLVDRVVVTVRGETEKVDVVLHWVGGHQMHAELIRPVAKLDQLSYYDDLMDRVEQLHHQGHTAKAIAATLNAEGWRPAKRRDDFNPSMVRSLMLRRGLSKRAQRATSHPTKQKSRHWKANEWTLQELAHELDMPQVTLYSWLRKGELNARRETWGTKSRWIIEAGKTELARLRSKRAAPRTWPLHRRVDSENATAK